MELIALAAVAGTPVALFLDYRAHTDLVARTVIYLPVGENGGRPAPYEQIWGLTQVLWLAAALGVLVVGGWRKIAQNGYVLLLILGLDVLVGVTAARGGIDSTTVLCLGATLVPYIAMVAVVRHPSVTTRTLRDLVTIACVSGAIIVVLTIAKDVLDGALADRLQTFAFGPPPESGVVLAPLLLLVPAMAVRRSAKIVTALCLGVGLALTQTRGGILAAVLGGVVFIAAGRRRLRVPALVALAVVAVTYVLASRRTFAFTDLATSYREQNLRYHWHLFLDHPLFGSGISYQSLNAVRAAHNTLLSVADAGGVLLLLLWVAAWVVLPLATAFMRRRRLGATPVGVAATIGAAATIAVLVGWNTTGSDVFDYNPPTNLLPLALGVALIGPLIYPERARRLSPVIARSLAAVGLVVALAVAGLGIAGVTYASGSHRMPADLRGRALVAAEGIALSTCRHCSVSSLEQVAPGIVEARLAGVQHAEVPSSCFFIVPREYRPRPPGVLPPGVSWDACVGGPVPGYTARAWLGAPVHGKDDARLRARVRSAARRVASVSCSACRIRSLSELARGIWFVRLAKPTVKPSPCFDVTLADYRPTSPGTPPRGVTWVRCPSP